MLFFLAPESLPFAIAAVMLAAFTGIEILCLLLGFSLGEATRPGWTITTRWAD